MKALILAVLSVFVLGAAPALAGQPKAAKQQTIPAYSGVPAPRDHGFMVVTEPGDGTAVWTWDNGHVQVFQLTKAYIKRIPRH